MEIKARQTKSLPANMLCDDTFFIKVTQALFADKFKTLVQLAEARG